MDEIKIGQKMICRRQLMLEVISEDDFEKEAPAGCLADPDCIQYRITHETNENNYKWVDQCGKEALLKNFMPWDR